MAFHTHLPPPPLSDFLASIWLNEGPPAPHGKDRILPTGMIGLMINLQEDEIRTYDRETGRVPGCLSHRLLAAPTPEAKFRVVETALLERMARDPERHPAVRFALREFLQVPHARTVAEVTDQMGLSPRRFIQVFAEQVGLTPKLFCRVRRFHEVMRRVHQGSRIDWTEVALSCGYFDQAHFIRDFRAFSGLNPSAWLAQRGEHLNHVPILD